MNRCLVRSAVPFVLAAGIAGPAGAQLVTPKTVPVHQDEQFAIFPSSHAGLAGLSIAIDDTLGDPFGNPAKATRIRYAAMFATPFSHSVTSGRGGGHTLPVGGLATFGEWSGGGVLAIQQLNQGPAFTQVIGDRQASNQYAMGVLARRLPNGISVGGSAYVAGLGAVDGVDLLYQGSDHIDQSGTLTDLRLGATKEWERGQRVEFVVLHNRTSMTQDVHYHTFLRFDPVNRQTVWNDRTDNNLDHTNIWGAHTQFVAPVGTEGWRIGAIATANHLEHPKIPNYQIQNIPRDPGGTFAYNVGVGAARTFGLTSFGVDVIAEPMFSHTWGTAGKDTSSSGGPVIRAGESTVDNRFRFTNSKIRVGAQHDFALARDTSSTLGFQLGLSVYQINYRLRQADHVRNTLRTQDEGWTEWTPSLGLRWRTKSIEVQYTYRRTCGPSSCDFGTGDRVTIPPSVAVDAGGVIAAPSSPLTIDGGTVRMHQLGVVIPIR